MITIKDKIAVIAIIALVLIVLITAAFSFSYSSKSEITGKAYKVIEKHYNADGLPVYLKSMIGNTVVIQEFYWKGEELQYERNTIYDKNGILLVEKYLTDKTYLNKMEQLLKQQRKAKALPDLGKI